jgi:hypothetical protein
MSCGFSAFFGLEGLLKRAGGVDQIVVSREMLLDVFDSLVDRQAGIVSHAYRPAMHGIETRSYATQCRQKALPYEGVSSKKQSIILPSQYQGREKKKKRKKRDAMHVYIQDSNLMC